MCKYIRIGIVVFLMLLLLAAIVIIITGPTYNPRHPRTPNHNNLLETVAAMEWAFPGGHDSAFYYRVLEQFETMYALFSRDANYAVIYPDFYGGIGVNGSQLTLLVVESRLEEAKEHEAFRYFFDDNESYSFVEFSFAQLLETRNLAATAINARRRCFYANNALTPRILAADNRVEVVLRKNDARDRDMEAGFRQYVFDSPMVNAVPGYVFTLGHRIHPIVPVAWLLIGINVLVGIPVGIVKLARKFKGCYGPTPVLLLNPPHHDGL